MVNSYDRAYGTLRVTKTIAGKGSGSQGRIVLRVTCDDPAYDRMFATPAGRPAGSHPQAVIDGIPAGTRCAVTEPSTGENAAVKLSERPVIEPPTATVTDGVTAAIVVRNTYQPRRMVPSSESSVRTLPSTGATSEVMWAAQISATLLAAGLGVLLYQRRRTRR